MLLIAKRMISLFEGKEHALLYSKYRPTYPRNLVEEIVKYSHKEPIEQKLKLNHMLDLGCGNGQSTFLFSEYFNKITATDPSIEQINNAKKKNLYDNITFRHGTAEFIDLPKHSVDVISCGQCAHWFHLPSFLQQCEHILAPNGYIAIYGYGTPTLRFYDKCNEKDNELQNIFMSLYNKCPWHKNRSHVEDKYSKIYSEIPFTTKIRNDTMYIERLWTLDDLCGYISSWSGYQSYKKDNLEEDTLTDFKNSISEISFQPKTDIKLVVKWDLFLLLSHSI